MSIWRSILFFFIFLNLFSISNSYAQRDQAIARNHYINFDYELAIPFYLKALVSDSSLENIEQVAECYRQTHKYKEAAKYYGIALEIPYYTPNSVFYYAEMLLQIGKYDEAQIQYEFYKNYDPPNIDYIDRRIESCKFARIATQHKLSVIIENIKEINTKFSESGIYVGQKFIYFSSDKKGSSNTMIDAWTGNSYLKIYTLPYQFKNNKITFQKAKLFTQNINAGYHVSFPSFSAAENKLYYTTTAIEKNPKKTYQIKASDFINKMNITSASLIGKRWVVDSNLKPENSFHYSILHPCINAEGTRLYFASDMPEGYGSYDLYYCEIDEKGQLSKPINLGNKINTSGMEVFPSYATNEYLYFSSKGQIGFGGLDIFKASISNNAIISVENIGYPINSSYDDFSYFPLKENNIALFCSDREGGKGKDDIYKIEYKK